MRTQSNPTAFARQSDSQTIPHPALAESSNGLAWMKFHHADRINPRIRSMTSDQTVVWVWLQSYANEQEDRGTVRVENEKLTALDICGGDVAMLRDGVAAMEFLGIVSVCGRPEGSPSLSGTRITFQEFRERQYIHPAKPSDSAERTRERKRAERARKKGDIGKMSRPVTPPVTPLSRPVTPPPTPPLQSQSTESEDPPLTPPAGGDSGALPIPGGETHPPPRPSPETEAQTSPSPSTHVDPAAAEVVAFAETIDSRWGYAAVNMIAMKYPPRWVKEALVKAVVGVERSRWPRVSYLIGILRRFHEQGGSDEELGPRKPAAAYRPEKSLDDNPAYKRWVPPEQRR